MVRIKTRVEMLEQTAKATLENSTLSQNTKQDFYINQKSVIQIAEKKSLFLSSLFQIVLGLTDYYRLAYK